MCQCKLPRHDLAEQTPVRQACKRIVVRKLAEVCVELFHLLTHYQGGVVGSLPVKVGLGISLADHIEESGEVDLTAIVGSLRKLVG